MTGQTTSAAGWPDWDVNDDEQYKRIVSTLNVFLTVWHMNTSVIDVGFSVLERVMLKGGPRH